MASAHKKHYKWLVVLLSLAVFGIVTTSAFLYYQNIQTSQRLDEFYLIEKDIRDETIDIALVEDFVDEYDGSLQAELLMYYTALHYFSKKKFQEAENWLLLTKIEQKSTVSTLSKLLLANIYQQQKKYEASNSVLETIDVPSMADYLLLEIIQNNILAKKTAEARNLLEVFFQNHKSSNLKATAEEISQLIKKK